MLPSSFIATPSTVCDFVGNMTSSNSSASRTVNSLQRADTAAGFTGSFPRSGLLASGMMPASVYGLDDYNVTPLQYPWQRLQYQQPLQQQQHFPYMMPSQPSFNPIGYHQAGTCKYTFLASICYCERNYIFCLFEKKNVM